MSKAVLISIQPNWCQLIANGKKTVEVRKSRPKLEMPFKCYIYCTKGKSSKDDTFNVVGYNDGENIYDYRINGKVFGEFVCDGIISHCEMANADIAEQQGRISREKLAEYSDGKELFGWHISDLKVYDEPKDLTDFFVEGECYPSRCSKCKYFDKGNGYNVEDDCLLPHHLNDDGNDIKPLFKAPQSWCYVEEV